MFSRRQHFSKMSPSYDELMSQQTIGVSIPLSIIPREQELYKIGQNREMPTVDIHNKPRFDQNFDNKRKHIL